MNLPQNAALEGIRVLDLSRILAGPWTGQMLADYGADVIKIERPNTGDDTRHWGPPFVEESNDSAYFMCANRGKRSVAVDLSQARGQEIIKELAQQADILIENFKLGSLKRYGLDSETLRTANPRLIYCSISGFGQTGPYSTRAGYDFMIQGLSGLMSITGKPDTEAGGEPMRAGVAVSDLNAGMHATTAIMAALLQRARTNIGTHIDISLFDVQVAMLANQASNFLNGSTVPGRIGNTHPNIVPYQVVQAQDRPFILAVGNDQQFQRCCEVLGVSKLSQDTRFKHNSDRVENRDALMSILAERIATRSADHWLSELTAKQIPAGAINKLDEVFDDPHTKARGLAVKFTMENSNSAEDHTTHETKVSAKTRNVYGVINPVRFDHQTLPQGKTPPRLAEHTSEVLQEWLDLSKSDIQALNNSGAIQISE